MTAHFKVSVVIDRPVATVFQFCAVDHVRNHPRWDPDMELWQISDGPIGVGTMIRRRNSRSGTPVDGTMEVTEFEPDRAMGMLIHDGPAVMNGRMLFEAHGADRTLLTTLVEIPGMDDSADKTFLVGPLEQRDQRIKRLIESET